MIKYARVPTSGASFQFFYNRCQNYHRPFKIITMQQSRGGSRERHTSSVEFQKMWCSRVDI